MVRLKRTPSVFQTLGRHSGRPSKSPQPKNKLFLCVLCG